MEHEVAEVPFEWSSDRTSGLTSGCYIFGANEQLRGSLRTQHVRSGRRCWWTLLPSVLISRERTRSLLLPTRIMGVLDWLSLSSRRSWATRWKLRRSVTEKTRMQTSHLRAERSCHLEKHITLMLHHNYTQPTPTQTNTHTHFSPNRSWQWPSDLYAVTGYFFSPVWDDTQLT